MGRPSEWLRTGRVHAMFFDAGNTLMRMDYDVLAGELARQGFAVDAAVLRAAELRVRVRIDAWLAKGASTEGAQTGARFLEYWWEEIGLKDPNIAGAAAEWMRDYNPPAGLWTTLDPEALSALAFLREHGVRAAVISNSNGSVRSVLAGLGVDSQLEFVLDSKEVGTEKPHPAIFQMALERAGVTPDQAIHVGDLYSVDVLGARAAGIDAILLDPAGEWGARDCVAAHGLLEACRLAIARE